MKRYEIFAYGDTVRFDSLAEAQRAIRDCGSGFERVSLKTTFADVIVNESGETVGRVIEAAAESPSGS